MRKQLMGAGLVALLACLVPSHTTAQVGSIGDDAATTPDQDCSLICLTKYLNLDLDGIGADTTAIKGDTTRSADDLDALVIAAASVQLKPTASAAACKVLLAAAGTFYGASGVAAAAGYVFVFDHATDPGDGSGQTPIAVVQVLAAGSWSFTAGPPVAVANGATVCTSSTGPWTKTNVTSTALAGNFITGQAN